MREENWFIRRFFYRLYPNVVAIHMPALREIRSDIPLLATHFLRKYTTEIGRDIQGFSQDALTALATYHWPGNVRELQNVISRAVSVSKGEVIRADDSNMGFYDDPDEESGSLVTK
jgi:two-component system NtrC family response regulator